MTNAPPIQRHAPTLAQQAASQPDHARVCVGRDDGPELLVSPGLTDYEQALAFMDQRQEAVAKGQARELVWFLQHPALYTAGTSAKSDDLLTPDRFPVYQTGRGGQYTYHGPGQRVAYLVLDLNKRGKDVRAYVAKLELWLIAALQTLGVKAEVREDRVGLWVARPNALIAGQEDKIAAIGVRIRRWVTSHGIALNVAPDLSHFAGIVPCGIQDHGVTSLAALGLPHELASVDSALITAFADIFGTPLAPAPKPLQDGLPQAEAS